MEVVHREGYLSLLSNQFEDTLKFFFYLSLMSCKENFRSLGNFNCIFLLLATSNYKAIFTRLRCLKIAPKPCTCWPYIKVTDKRRKLSVFRSFLTSKVVCSFNGTWNGSDMLVPVGQKILNAHTHILFSFFKYRTLFSTTHAHTHYSFG